MAYKNLIAQELKKIKEKYHLTNEEWSNRSGVPVARLQGFCHPRSISRTFRLYAPC